MGWFAEQFRRAALHAGGLWGGGLAVLAARRITADVGCFGPVPDALGLAVAAGVGLTVSLVLTTRTERNMTLTERAVLFVGRTLLAVAIPGLILLLLVLAAPGGLGGICPALPWLGLLGVLAAAGALLVGYARPATPPPKNVVP